ncbi:SPW repeat domain-containing protein [Myxococcus sp. Y35]|uniref:SPW repeat domain-containing protein n=1 Tax=Pseudomyxococcus flavus TaxID=3115648 RepID=UPI003CF3E77F
MAEPQTQSPSTPRLVPPPAPVEGRVRRGIHRAMDRSAAAGIMSRPLLGRLPLRRWVPQDLHSLMDYKGGTASVVAGVLSGDPVAKSAGVALGATILGVSLLTDYRLSLTKLIPIEAHEIADHAFGAASILAPFVLGYAKRHPVAAAIHVVVGVSTILASLVTDYRCQTGMHLGGELATDPGAIGA